ncbi:MAG: ATP-binding protein [Chitinispirillales bacterium]|jgi:AAA15 family ATPase/GTPase|nr:ATP-binding protein [Chitinispirillales bacterium]
MLVEFKVKNYKSFAEETIFSMVAAQKQKGLDYSLLKKKVRIKVDGKIKKKTINGLCSSVIYGPNAAGKTNIIGAMETLKEIVLRGDIKNRNPEKESSPNTAAFILETIPNTQISESQPVEFSIEFIENDWLINYTISIDLDSFFNNEYQRSIIKEILTVNGDVIFDRKKDLLISINLKIIEDYISDSAKRQENVACGFAKDSLQPETLFLTNGFKSIFSVKFAEFITNWFKNKFRLIYRSDAMKIIKEFEKPQTNQLYLEKPVSEAIRLFGVNANDVGYVVRDNDSEPVLCSICKNMQNGKTFAMSAELIESLGTIRFINLFPLVLDAIKNGRTLVIDEFDASIHPMALMSIINIFHNDDINVKNAQLIFNTHNPIFLNSNLFRRDEIKFVERDDDTHFSTLYSLSDFGTTGEKGVRKHEDYMKNYFISQYGAIKDIDFTPIFEEMLPSKNKDV